MDYLRTPDSCFDNLPDYPFSPHYEEVDGLRLHYVDECPKGTASKDAPVIVMLHGEPTWSYLYRKMIPLFVAAGYRAIAPDLVGFGRSDKPTARDAYSYERHVEWMRTLLFDRLDLQDVTLVCQDWGGLIGLRLVAENVERFARVVAGNTFLPAGEDMPGEMFTLWKEMSQEMPEWAALIDSATEISLSQAELAAYDAPFPDESYKAGSREFPFLVPTSPDNVAVPACLRAWESLRKFDKPFLSSFSDKDPILGHYANSFDVVPGSKGQPQTTITNAGHFLQEDNPEDFAEAVIDLIKRSS